MSKVRLHSIELAGFRAYLKPQTIELKSRNLAIFAPNGRGKSSLADAIVNAGEKMHRRAGVIMHQG